jgi:BirA family transcriptional regulator, biotin operon repressor / biotin---[acetyl-CoA-carboxylase] ligase
MPQRLFLSEITSTNSYLQELLETKQATAGDAVYTFNQTQGRGQKGNQWVSQPGKNVLLSIAIEPEFLPARNQFLLSELAALAVKKVLDEYVDNVCIKWPNDIYIKDRKVAGILIENRLKDSKIEYSVVGIGVNINQTKFPSDLPNPISLHQLIDKEIDKDIFTEKLHDSLCNNLLIIDTEKNDEVRRYYLNSLYRRDGFHPYRDANGDFMAKILDVNASGRLMLEMEDGKVSVYDLKEVAFLAESPC